MTQAQKPNLDEAAEIFEQAVLLDGASKDEYIRTACDGNESLRIEIESMLHARDQQGHFLNEPTAEFPSEPTAGSSSRVGVQVGDTIGRYKLLQQIGEGGFGTVYLAEQREPIARRVALKIIKAGMDSRQVIARFEAERQALAMMDHPNVCGVLDCGTTEMGRPYFVMEYIRGIPLLEFCEVEELDTHQRLGLFVSVCRAVQHAHQKGIIHRDLKPSNVLVTMHDGVPVPKVIDFGIVKATNARLTDKTLFTEHRQLIGTPAYMSPEQAEMSGLDVDTRSDIYSLGVLLYELLTGTTPFDGRSLVDAGYAEMMRIIREEEPDKPSKRLSLIGTGTFTASRHRPDPSSLSLTLRGDLDWIVMRCLEKDRTRRYDTAQGVIEDLQRFQANEPVLAGPPSALYRLRKFVKRHRGGVAAGSAIGALLLLGLAGTTYGLLVADTQRRMAANQAEQLQQVVDFQSRQLRTIRPEAMGAQLRAAVLSAAPESERERLEAVLIAINFTTIGLQSLQDNVFEPTVRAIDEEFAAQPLVQAQLMQALSMTMGELGLIEAATRAQQRALDIRLRESGEDDADTLISINDMGSRLSSQGRYEEAETYIRRALEGRRRLLGEDHPDTLASLNNLGAVLWHQGRLDEAKALMLQSLEGRRGVLGEDHPSTLLLLNNLGGLHYAQGEAELAEQYLRRALEGRRRVLGEDHPKTLSTLGNLGAVVALQGRFDEAAQIARETLDGQRRVLGDEHADTLKALDNIGLGLRQLGRPDEAEPYLREALDGRRRVLGEDHPNTLASLDHMGGVARDRGDLVEAERLERLALDGRRRVLGNEHIDTLDSLNGLGSVLIEMGRYTEAEALLRESVRTGARVPGRDSRRQAEAVSLLGAALTGMGEYDQAEALLLESFEALATRMEGQWRELYLPTAARRLAELYDAWGKPDRAAPWRAIADRTASSLDPPNPQPPP